MIVSFNVFADRKEDLKGLKFFYLAQDTKLMVFEFTDAHIDSLSSNYWNKIEFFFYCKFPSETSYLEIHSISGKKGQIKFKDFTAKIDNQNLNINENNLVNNSSFEDVYYFPNPNIDNCAFSDGLLYWNDFNYTKTIISSIDRSKDSLIFYHGITTIGTRFSNIKSYRFIPYDGNYCLLIQNEYVYSDKDVPLNTTYNTVYVQSKLKNTLIKDSVYLLEFYILLPPGSEKADNSLGVRFTEGIFNPDKEVDFHDKSRPLPKADIIFFDDPIVEKEWTKLSFQYKARGGEDFICFGVFQNPNHKKIILKPFPKKSSIVGSPYLIDCVSLMIR